jgi:hypothetical protein
MLNEVRAAQRRGWAGAVHVFIVTPPGVSDEWWRSPLCVAAPKLLDTFIHEDRGGSLARHFGAATSGHALLVDVDGRLLFAGGLTPTRGSAGDGAILIAAARGELTQRPTFGCPLFDSPKDDPSCPVP